MMYFIVDLLSGHPAGAARPRHRNPRADPDIHHPDLPEDLSTPCPDRCRIASLTATTTSRLRTAQQLPSGALLFVRSPLRPQVFGGVWRWASDSREAAGANAPTRGPRSVGRR